MQNTYLFQVFQALGKSDRSRLRKFLQSPFHNRRADVLELFDYLLHAGSEPEPRQAWAAVYPEQVFQASQFHLLSTYLLGLIEDYLAYEEWAAEGLQRRLYLVRALRKREIGPHFERQARLLEREHRANPMRHAGHFLTAYQIQNEIFAHQVVSQRNWADNLQALTDALGYFFVLENLRWSGMVQSLRQRTGAEIPHPPLAEPAQAWAAQADAETLPAVALLYQSFLTLSDADNPEHFLELKKLLPRVTTLFPTAESRDIYMAAINFCIRRQNKGERLYAREAFDLYRTALQAGILLENGILPKYTFNNINALAHLVGEADWARAFLDQHHMALLPAERENIYRYNLAIYHFRRSDYGQALELLREVTFTEVFINLDVRRMLLRSYFELGEWTALASLLDSFRAYLDRQKGLGNHRESYLNLIRFTQKLAQSQGMKRAQAVRLAQKIQQTERLAEREWLLGKLPG
ncbi:MAG: hypothetical protein IT260_02295 [Saprospiraceae bacterium]|nr:hypothetical protein [Saprospiraceae bacterium]